MRFVTFAREAGDTRGRPGALLDDLSNIVDLGHRFSSLLELIERGEAGLAVAREAIEAAAHTVALADVRLLAPLPEPRQFRDCMVYEKHLRQAMAQGGKISGAVGEPPPIPPVWYHQPVYYKSNRLSVIGTGADVRWPTYSNVMDFELEIALVIGRKVRDLTPERAAEAVFGYMIFNDMSARDAQMAEMGGGLGPAKGKDFDTGNVLGPWLVTADVIGDIRRLKVRASVNGRVVADTTAADMQHDVSRVLVHISASETLYPGEVIGLGTIGDCCLLEHGRSLSPGDVITLEVEELGRQENRLVRDS